MWLPDKASLTITPHPLLSSSSPAVVGTLWGVTDGEIDQVLNYMIKYFKGELLPNLVKTARSSVKLSHLTGYSAVVYGLPMKTGHI